ncbi:hypothetical protein ACIA8K_22345 [Catenuloplanes sp. NPDC051500]|uniref:hypothetical protein n=1 Tax=Catenuloplanes sp. NPDC051500 TaxID=3363959 RepID=UPI00379A85AF
MNRDDELLASLRRIASEIDAPPPGVLDAARAAFLTRDLDGEIAVLIADSRSADSPTDSPVRAAPEETAGRWLLSFSGGGVDIDIEVEEGTAGLRLFGQFTGVSGDDVRLETAGGARALEVDELGRFLISGVPHGAIRVRCRAEGGAPVTTAWVTI